ncbi:MAG: hypothetical protein KAQ64_02615 [Candidatus Pacebacteria bacterium]|nr:hypothetical protein [Candidatus Paceibacterota bacterium]
MEGGLSMIMYVEKDTEGFFKDKVNMLQAIRRINGDICKIRKGISEIKNYKRRIIMRDVLKNKEGKRTKLCLRLEELNIAITQNMFFHDCLEIGGQ